MTCDLIEDVLPLSESYRRFQRFALAHLPERASRMTYVITEPCIDEKDAACLEVCPVDCIHATEEDEQYYIDPRICIDCGACQPVCPVHAIYEAAAVPERWRSFIRINAAYFSQVKP